MVDDVLAGQLPGQVAGRGQDHRGPGIKVGVGFLEPQDLWPDGLRGQRIAAALVDGGLADAGVQGGDLVGCAGVDAVKDAVHQGVSGAVHGQHAGADGAGGDGFDVAGVEGGLGKQRLGDVDKIAPPVLIRPVFGPTGAGDQHLVRSAGLRGDPALRVDEDALGFEGADVNSKGVGHRVSFRSWVMADRAASIRVTRPVRSAGSTTSRAEWE